MRTYALYDRARWVLWTLVSYVVAATVVTVWTIVSAPAQHITHATHTGCQSGLSLAKCVRFLVPAVFAL